MKKEIHIKEETKETKQGDNILENEDTSEKTEQSEKKDTFTRELSDELVKKLDSFEKELATLKNELEKKNDLLLRKAAEFENYKRRSENDTLNLLKYAAEPTIINILSIYNDFDRTIKHLDETDNLTSLKEGIKLIHTKFTRILDDQGVKKIESVGKPFDFNLHEALLQKEAEGVESQLVIEEVQPGYMYKDKVIIHAQVIVAK